MKDESDISIFVDLHKNNMMPKQFDALDVDRIIMFADKFGQRKLFEKYLGDEKSLFEGPQKL